MIHPDGAKRNASANAAAAWGTERSGDRARCMSAKSRVPLHAATKIWTSAKEQKAVTSAVAKLRAAECQRPGIARSERQGGQAKRPFSPSAGR